MAWTECSKGYPYPFFCELGYPYPFETNVGLLCDSLYSPYVLGDHHKFLIIYRDNAMYGLMDVNAMLMVPSMSSYLNLNFNFAFGFKYKLCVKC